MKSTTKIIKAIVAVKDLSILGVLYVLMYCLSSVCREEISHEITLQTLAKHRKEQQKKQSQVKTK